MQALNFEEGKVYIDRENIEYTYIERRHGVTIFKAIADDKIHVRNLNGQYRWDNKEDSRDIQGCI